MWILFVEHFSKYKSASSMEPNIGDPIILWWTDGSDQPDEDRICGDVRCFITGNRSYMNNPLTKVFLNFISIYILSWIIYFCRSKFKFVALHVCSYCGPVV